jgi:hypothetical protein
MRLNLTVETGAITCMAGCSNLLNFEQKGITIAIESD